MKIFNRQLIFFIRLFLVLISAILGYLIGKEYWQNDLLSYVGLLFGFTIGFIVIIVERSMESVSTKKDTDGRNRAFCRSFL